MSRNVHLNPGPGLGLFSVPWKWNWRGRSVQCCTGSKWVHLKCLRLSSKFRTLGSSHSWSCPCYIRASSGDPTPTSTVASCLNSSSLYTSTVQSGPPLLSKHSHPTFAFKPLISILPALYLLPLHPHRCSMLLAVSLHSCFLLQLILSRFFNRMLGVSKPGAPINITKLEHLHRAASRTISSCLLSSPIPLLLSEASLPPLRVTLAHFALSSYEQALCLLTSFCISGLARHGVKSRLCRSFWRAFASTHPFMLH